MRKQMQRRGPPKTGSIIFAAGVVLGLAAFGGSTSLPGQNSIANASSPFAVGTATHVTRAESQIAPGVPSVSEIPAQADIGLRQGPVPTRSSFIADWVIVGGATAYLMDVLMSISFDS